MMQYVKIIQKKQIFSIYGDKKMSEKRFNPIINEDNEIEYIEDLKCLEDIDCAEFFDLANELSKENDYLKSLIKQVLETTPIKHSLAVQLKNSVRELL